MSITESAAHTAEQFKKKFGRSPRWIVAAPGRVNVIGEHTDYNDGFVLPMAIERYTVIAADASVGGKAQLQLATTEGKSPATVDISTPLTPGNRGWWANYPLGVVAGFAARGVKVGGFDAMIHSTVPLGGGLSSSAALEVSTATLLEVMTGHKLDLVDKALLCQKAEHEYAGVPCGIMDQFISVMGKKDHLLLIDCRTRKPELVPMNDSSLGILIVNTNVKHELGSGEYAKRRAQCEAAAKIIGVPSLRDASGDALEQARSKMDEVVFRRARHVITEIARTTQAAAGIKAGNWPTVGQLMYGSHYSLKDDYEVSCAELDVVVEIAQSIGPKGGVIGCRMTGGGFGGCCVALVQADKVEAIQKTIATEYKKRTNIEATMFVSRPGPGATVIQG